MDVPPMTIYEEAPTQCDDCGDHPTFWHHWGVYAAKHNIVHCCQNCWEERIRYYEQHGENKPQKHQPWHSCPAVFLTPEQRRGQTEPIPTPPPPQPRKPVSRPQMIAPTLFG